MRKVEVVAVIKRNQEDKTKNGGKKWAMFHSIDDLSHINIKYASCDPVE